jgi:hypothetical protein
MFRLHTQQRARRSTNASRYRLERLENRPAPPVLRVNTVLDIMASPIPRGSVLS